MIKLPMLTPGMEHALLAKWRVKPGDVIRAGDVVAEIETDKATIEVESAVAGVIDELCVAEGTADVKVDTILARLRNDPPAANEPDATRAATHGRRRLMASPLARRMARAAKVDLARIAGSGPRGRVTKRDVEAVLATAPEKSASLTALGIVPGSYHFVPLDGMRKSIARRLSDSFRDAPHFALSIDLRVDELLSMRSQLNALTAKDGAKVSINDMIVRAAATALTRVPAANASYTADGIAIHHDADIAVAVAVEGGLVTPIVRAAQTKSLSSIAAEMKELSALARSKRLQPQQFRGGTFSVSNLGMHGIRSFTSILNPPHGCIMSVGAAEQRVIVRDGAPAVAWMMTVTLTCDHRVVDGAIGAQLLTAFREVIESPVALLV
jgi:pyruvate dehydrogenase E2 component (dihydrolipoamide acetyltransferase)